MGFRETLRTRNGLRDLDRFIVGSDSSSASEAAATFREHGFVIVKDALNGQALDALQQACHREAAGILAKDPVRLGNAGGGRYSWGQAQVTGHLLHCPEWAALADVETVGPVLEQIFEDSGYVCVGAGGDFVVDLVQKYQGLRADLTHTRRYERDDVPVVIVSYTTSPLTWENGPPRVVPGSHRLPEGTSSRDWQPPKEEEESQDSKFSSLCPLPEGCAVLWDARVWRGGTPNMSDSICYLPHVEFAAKWWCKGRSSSTQSNQWVQATPCMPSSVHKGLSPRAQEVCRLVVDDEVWGFGVREDFGCIYHGPTFVAQTRRAPPAAQRQLREIMTGLPPGTGPQPSSQPVPPVAAAEVDVEVAGTVEEDPADAEVEAEAEAAAVEVQVEAKKKTGKEEEGGEALEEDAIYFGMHSDWCDHIVFLPDGRFELAHTPPGRPSQGRWRLLRKGTASSELFLELHSDGLPREHLLSVNEGASFQGDASAGEVAALVCCGEVALKARHPPRRSTVSRTGRLCGPRLGKLAWRLCAAALALRRGGGLRERPGLHMSTWGAGIPRVPQMMVHTGVGRPPGGLVLGMGRR